MATTVKEKEPKIDVKKLSKLGKWWLKHPNGIGEIIDYKAVLK